MENNKNIKTVLILIIFILIAFVCGLLCCDVIVGNNLINKKDSVSSSDNVEKTDYENVKQNDRDIQIEESNPIDKYYLPKYDNVISTYELVEISDNHFTAWKNEFENIVTILKDKYSFYEDKEYFDDYIKKYNELATLSAEIEYLNWIDTTIKPKERLAGTGSSYASINSMIDICRQGCLNLISKYESSNQDSITSYSYIFNTKNN